MSSSANLLTVREVAERLQVTTRTIYALVKKRELAHCRVGSLLRFKEEDLAEFVRTSDNTQGSA